MLGYYDRVIALAARRPTSDIDPAILDVLRLACHQLLSMRVAAHAAVDDSVSLARTVGSNSATGFVNGCAPHHHARARRAVARAGARGDDDPRRAAVGRVFASGVGRARLPPGPRRRGARGRARVHAGRRQRPRPGEHHGAAGGDDGRRAGFRRGRRLTAEHVFARRRDARARRSGEAGCHPRRRGPGAGRGIRARRARPEPCGPDRARRALARPVRGTRRQGRAARGGSAVGRRHP